MFRVLGFRVLGFRVTVYGLQQPNMRAHILSSGPMESIFAIWEYKRYVRLGNAQMRSSTRTV